jgi:hypothetical protein
MLTTVKNALTKKSNTELLQPAKKDIEKYIPIEKVQELKEKYRNMLTDKFSLKDIKFIMLSLYSNNDLPPLRSQDYYNCKIVNTLDDMDKDEHKNENNYILLTEKMFIRNTGKTFNRHGPRFIEMPEPVINDIKNFQQKSKSQWLIPNPKNINNHIEQSHFSKLLSRTIQQEFGTNKKIASSYFRKMRVSKEISDILKEYPQYEQKNEKLKKLSKDMGHSIDIQQAVYAKLKTII